MNNQDLDKLKYRNEIEALSRLKGKVVNDLYNDEINEKVTSALNEVYPEPDLTLDNPGNRFNELVNKIKDNDCKTDPVGDLIIPNDLSSAENESIKVNNLKWDEYFMNIAILTSLRSKDTNTKVGSVLVDKKNRVIGCGYNGLPSNINETLFPTSRDLNLPYNETKYAYVVHAELNALLNCTVYDLSDSKLYVTLFPCCDCVKVLLQKGISEVIYLSDKHHDDPHYVAARKLLDAANVKYIQYNGNILIPFL